MWISAGFCKQYKMWAVNVNKKILHSLYFCEAVFGKTIKINLKFCRTFTLIPNCKNRFHIRQTLALKFLLRENLKKYIYFLNQSLYYKFMSQFYLIFLNYRNNYSSIFFPIPSYLISLQTSEILQNFLFCGWYKHSNLLYCKINAIETW